MPYPSPLALSLKSELLFTVFPDPSPSPPNTWCALPPHSARCLLHVLYVSLLTDWKPDLAAATIYLYISSIWHWEHKCKLCLHHTLTLSSVKKNGFGCNWDKYCDAKSCDDWEVQKSPYWSTHAPKAAWHSAPRTSICFSTPNWSLPWKHIEKSGHDMANSVIKNSEQLTNVVSQFVLSYLFVHSF